MNRLAFLNSIHMPSWVSLWIVSMGLQFSVQMNGSPVDLSTNEGRINALTAVVILLVKALQASPITPTK